MSETGFPLRPGHRVDPAIDAIVINYSGGDQSVNIPARAVYVGTAGDLKVDMVAGAMVTFTNLLAGHIYPFAVRKIYQTGSTAAGVILG